MRRTYELGDCFLVEGYYGGECFSSGYYMLCQVDTFTINLININSGNRYDMAIKVDKVSEIPFSTIRSMVVFSDIIFPVDRNKLFKNLNQFN